jgi:hypothetical protein
MSIRSSVIRYQTRKRVRRVAESVGSSLAGYYDKPVKSKRGKK